MTRQGGSGTSTARPKKRTALWVGLIAIFLIVAGGIVAAIFLLGGTKRSIAHEHLPAGCDAVARVDLESLRQVGPIAEHIMPALDEAAKESEDAGKMARFFLSAGLDPRKDLHEVAVCVTDLDRADVVVVIGGKMRPGGVVEALQSHDDDLEDIAIERVVEVEGRDILETKDGVFITQADDGAVVMGTSQALVEKAIPSGDAHEAYRLPLDQQIIGVITAEAVEEAGKRASGVPFARKLSEAGRAVFTVDLESRKARIELDMKTPAAAEELAGALGDFLRLSRLIPGSDPLRRLLFSTEFSAEGSSAVGKLDIPKKAVEDASRQIAERIRRAND